MTATKQDQLILTESTLNSHFAETFRALRANISFSSIDQPLKTILVTSAAPREGKTTTVLNLGIIMGQAGSRVVIVDADFRHPKLHRILRTSENGHGMDRNGSGGGTGALPGLSTVIVGKSRLEDVILPSAFDNVSLLPAGPLPPNPSELLASQRMRAVMTELERHADFILIDSPPCILYADAFVLSAVTNGVLYVLRAGAQDKAAQRRVQKHLEQAKAHVLGIVFNDVSMDDSASTYGYYYPSGNGHHK